MESGIVQVLMSGGWMMIPILLCSLLALTISLERWSYFRSLQSGRLAPDILQLVEQQEFSKAVSFAQEHPGPVLRVVAEGVRNRSQDPTKAMEAAGLSELALMKRGLSILDTIVTLGPLLGLLGTIIGMIDSFGVMSESGLGNPNAVTGGVAEALVCTAAGIFVAVTTLIPYNFFLRKMEKESELIELFATRTEAALHKRSDETHP